jgi:DedD protein
MRGVFDEREFRQAETAQDTELTLTPTLVLVLSMGLLLLCGGCFAVGYSLGHGSAQEASPVLPIATDGSIPTPVDSGRPKPSANVQQNSEAPSTTAAADDTPPSPSEARETVEDAAVSAASGSPTASSTSAGPPANQVPSQVRPAMGNTPGPAPAGMPIQGTVAPAMPGAGSLMVQIAAVSDQNDANVLMGALRKRGYAVAARREPLDGLIHVRIGPFKTRDDAETWREKLLNDGYNAIVQP